MGSSTKKQLIKKMKESPSSSAAGAGAGAGAGAALSDHQFQLLRSITNSSAMNKTSIIVDATKYIEELKEKVERLSRQETTTTSSSTSSSSSLQPVVRVETLEKGYLINVLSEKNSPGLLVAILEAFEELGLEVLDATVSCSHTFQLQAVGTGGEMLEDDDDDTMDAQMVKQAVQQAIQIWSESNGDDA